MSKNNTSEKKHSKPVTEPAVLRAGGAAGTGTRVEATAPANGHTGFSCDICGRNGFKSDQGVRLHKGLKHKYAQVGPTDKPRKGRREQMVHYCPGCGLNIDAIAMAMRVQI